MSLKVIFEFQNHLFLRCIFDIDFQACQHYEDVNFSLNEVFTSKVIQGHIRSLLSQNHSSTFVYGTILMKIFMNANILKPLYMKRHFYVIEFCNFFTLKFQT